jgi:hypothetical protein
VFKFHHSIKEFLNSGQTKQQQQQDQQPRVRIRRILGQNHNAFYSCNKLDRWSLQPYSNICC